MRNHGVSIALLVVVAAIFSYPTSPRESRLVPKLRGVDE